MANLKTIQFLRNATLYGSLEAAKVALTAKASTLLDGSPVIGRYTSGSETRSILGIVYNGTLSFFMNEKEIDNVLEGLDYSGITTSDAAVVTNVTEADGVVSASSENVGNLVLTDYVKGSDSGSVAATDSINEAVAKLENQIDAEAAARAAAIDALDYTGYTLGDSEVFATITEDNGVIAATGKNLSGIKLAGYAEGTDADIAATDTLGEALGKLQAQINAMDKDADVVAGQVVTTITEADGKVTETKANVKDLQLGGYQLDNSTGPILSADTINVALSKLENQIGANTVTNGDGSITVTTTGATTDVAVNIKSGEKVIMLDSTDGIYTDIKLSGITPSSTNVREEYALIASDGLTQLGSSIKVYKDSSLTNIYIGHVDDVLTNADSSGESDDTAVTNGTGDTALVYIMHLENDKYKLAAVNVQAFLEETEFGSGVTATNHVVHGVVDPTSESFLTVGAEGFKLAGVRTAISDAIDALDAVESGSTTHISVTVGEANGVLTAVTVTEDDIASAQGLADEITARTAADTELSNRLGTGVTTTNTATAQLIALSGDSNSVSGDTSVEGAKRYADAILANSVAGLDANVSGNSTHVTVGVVEEDGVITAVTVSESDIANATDLASLSGKAVTAVDMTGGTAAIANAEDGTKKITINTDGSQIFATNYDASSTAPDQQILTGDSINTALAKLYATSKAHHALSSSTVSVSEAANGTTFAVNVDNTTAHAASDDTYASDNQNMIQIKNGGLYVSSSIDCGTF